MPICLLMFNVHVTFQHHLADIRQVHQQEVSLEDQQRMPNHQRQHPFSMPHLHHLFLVLEQSHHLLGLQELQLLLCHLGLML